jgi:uncharacterized membrane protein
MNYPYVHLVVNHIPIVGNGLALFLLLLGYVKKNMEFKKAGLWILVASAFAAIPAFISGHRAADIVGELPGIAKDFIGAHEEAAEKAAIAIWVLGALSFIGLWLGKNSREIPKFLMILILAGSLVTGALMGYAANLGGQIHHEEIHKDFKPPAPGPEGAFHHHHED